MVWFTWCLTVAIHVSAAPLADLRIEGLKRTQAAVVESELGLRIGQDLSPADFEAALQRVRNTQLFSNVSGRIDPGGRAVVSLEEKWTTIPVAKFAAGGGVAHYVLGVYDPNIAGRYLELGAQYESLQGSSSGVAWFKDPRLWNTRFRMDLQYWDTERVRIKYDPDAEDPAKINGFLHERRRLHTALGYEWTDNLAADLVYESNRDRFSTRLIDAELKDLANTKGLPRDVRVDLIGPGLHLGRIHALGHRQRGTAFALQIRHARPNAGDLKDFWQADAELKHLRLVNGRHQIAQRLLAGTTSTDLLQYWNYLGGLDRVRGFADNRFAGRHYLLSNSEYRHEILNRGAAVAQALAFADLTAIGEQVGDLDRVHAASLGAGARLILPRFYRLVVRMDYARPVKKSDDQNFSFGVQQFF